MPEPSKPSIKAATRPQPAGDFLDLHRDTVPQKSQSELDAIRHKDLLSLKKQVIEEIKSEFESHDHDEQKALDQTQFAVCLHAILGKLRKDLEKEEQEDD